MEHTASEGKVWDFKNENRVWNEDTQSWEVIHLYTKVIFVNYPDSIDNYIEVDDPYKE